MTIFESSTYFTFGFIALMFFEVNIFHDLSHDETFLEVTVDLTSCLRCLCSFLKYNMGINKDHQCYWKYFLKRLFPVIVHDTIVILDPCILLQSMSQFPNNFCCASTCWVIECGRGLHAKLITALDAVDAARSAYDRSGIVAWTTALSCSWDKRDGRSIGA